MFGAACGIDCLACQDEFLVYNPIYVNKLMSMLLALLFNSLIFFDFNKFGLSVHGSGFLPRMLVYSLPLAEYWVYETEFCHLRCVWDKVGCSGGRFHKALILSSYRNNVATADIFRTLGVSGPNLSRSGPDLTYRSV
jgi:hypothetical protein